MGRVMIIAQSLASFHSYFEELQKAKEKKDFKSNCGYCGGAGRLILPSCPPKFRLCPNCNKKEEMGASDVEKAKEELRREIASCKYVADSSDVVLEGLFNKAKNLLNALDSQKEPELRDKKSCLSERETKLPWKDVSELPAIDFKAMIDLARYHLREIRSDTVGKPRDIPNAVESLTNIVESMLSRQEELENLIRKPSAEGKPSCVDWSFIYDSGLTPEQILICELMIQRQDELEARVRKLEGK